MGNTPHSNLKARGSREKLMELHQYLIDTELYKTLGLDDPAYTLLQFPHDDFKECPQLTYRLKSLHDSDEDSFQEISRRNNDVEIEFEYYFFDMPDHHYKMWLNGELVKDITQSEANDSFLDRNFSDLKFPRDDNELTAVAASRILRGALLNIAMNISTELPQWKDFKIKDKELQECLDDLNLMEFSRFNALNLLSEQIEIDYRLNLLPLKKLEEKEVEGAYYCGLTGRYHPNPPESILTERQDRSCS